eukprot:3918174-Amphidinium_carterae.1
MEGSGVVYNTTLGKLIPKDLLKRVMDVLVVLTVTDLLKGKQARNCLQVLYNKSKPIGRSHLVAPSFVRCFSHSD